MSLKMTAFLISHLTMADVYIYEYPSPTVVASSNGIENRYCPVADEFIRSGQLQSKVPLSTSSKSGSMTIVEHEGKRFVLALDEDAKYTQTQLNTAKRIFAESSTSLEL